MREEINIFEDCKTAEQVIAAVKGQGFEPTPKQAETVLNATLGELSDQSLEKVAGGIGFLIAKKEKAGKCPGYDSTEYYKYTFDNSVFYKCSKCGYYQE